MGIIALMFIFLMGFGIAKIKEQNRKTRAMVKLLDHLEKSSSEKYMRILNVYSE